jgi:O-antigen/teichoic acid export membrane protein
MTTYKKFTKDVGLAGIAKIADALKGLILLPILTKTLGAEFYGIWAQIMVTIGLLTPLALLQLEYAMTRFLTAEEDERKISKGISSIFVAVLFTAALISFLIFILAEPLAIAVFGGADAAYFVKISAFLILLTTLDQIILRYFVSFRQMKRYAGFMILQTIGAVVLIGYLVLSGYGLFGAIISLLLVRAFIFVIGFLLVKSEVKMTIPSLSVIKPYLTFSLPLIPFTLSWWLVNSGDRYVIGYFLGASEVGIYSASYTLGNMLSFLYAPIALVLFPAITNRYENNNIYEVKMHLKYTVKFFLMVAIPSLFGLTILSKSLLGILTTSEFIGAYMVVPIVALGALLFSMCILFSDILMLFKKTKIISLVFGSSALINLVMNILLVPLIGIMGAAIATLVTFAILFSILALVSFRNLFFDWDPKFVVKSILSSAVMGFVIWRMNPVGAVSILISIGIAAVVYFGVLLLLKGFTKDECVFFKTYFSTPK